MARAIVLPLYPHATDDEIAELLERLGELELSLAPVVVSGYVLPADEPAPRDNVDAVLALADELGLRPITEAALGDLLPFTDGRIAPDDELEELARNSSPIAGRPGWRRDRFGGEWYSAAWLDRRLS